MMPFNGNVHSGTLSCFAGDRASGWRWLCVCRMNVLVLVCCDFSQLQETWLWWLDKDIGKITAGGMKRWRMSARDKRRQRPREGLFKCPKPGKMVSYFILSSTIGLFTCYNECYNENKLCWTWKWKLNKIFDSGSFFYTKTLLSHSLCQLISVIQCVCIWRCIQTRN